MLLIRPHVPETTASGDGDRTSEAEWNRIHVISNALRAATRLAKQNKSADLSELESALDRLLQSDVRGGLRIEAEVLARVLDGRRPVAPAE